MSKLWEKWENWEHKAFKLKAILKSDNDEDDIKEWSDKATGIMVEGLDLVGETMMSFLLPFKEE